MLAVEFQTTIKDGTIAARRNVDQIQVRIENPLDWLQEVEQP